MSYAEYGQHIFFPRTLQAEKFLVRHEELAPMRSGYRLQMHDSFLDIRTWSPKQLETFQYFRDVTERQSAGKIVPVDYLIEMMKYLTTKSEVAILREEVERYKALQLTLTPVAPSTKTIAESKTEESDVTSQLVSESSVDEHVTLSNGDSESTSQASSRASSTGSMDSDCTRIIKDDSQLIALQDDLIDKTSEIEALKGRIEDLAAMLRERDVRNKKLEDHLVSVQRQLEIFTERNTARIDQRRIGSGKDLPEQLQTKSDGQLDHCHELTKRMRKLELRQNDEERRIKRETVNRQLEDLLGLLKAFGEEPSKQGLENILVERKKLVESEKCRHLQYLDDEDEIVKLWQLMNRMCEKYEERENQLLQIIDNLKSESRSKNKKLDEYKDQMTSMLKGFEDKMLYEKSLLDRKVEDKNIDKALAYYLEKSGDKLNELCTTFQHLQSNGGPTLATHKWGPLKNEVTEMKERPDQVVKKKRQTRLYHTHDEDYQMVLQRQLTQLRDGDHNKFDRSSAIVDEVKTSPSEVELKCNELQKKHQSLTIKIQDLNTELTQKLEKILDLENTKDSLSCMVNSYTIDLKSKTEEITWLKAKNKQIEEKLKEAEQNAEAIRSKADDSNHEGALIDHLTFVQKEIGKLGKDKKTLEESISQLGEKFKNYCSINHTMNRNLNDRLNEREYLQGKIIALKEKISHLSDELSFNNFDKKNIMSLSVKLCESIDMLAKRLSEGSAVSDGTRQPSSDRMQHDVEEYQYDLFRKYNEEATLAKCANSMPRNLQCMKWSKDEFYKIGFKREDPRSVEENNKKVVLTINNGGKPSFTLTNRLFVTPESASKDSTKLPLFRTPQTFSADIRTTMNTDFIEQTNAVAPFYKNNQMNLR